MKQLYRDVLDAAIEYNSGDAKRIMHLIKVFTFCETLLKGERVSPAARDRIALAGILHDIGIHESERLYGDCSGAHQQTEGKRVAREILEGCGVDPQVTDRVCDLVAKHHTYTEEMPKDLRILIEADFLVNCYEDNLKREAVATARKKIFRTKTGISLLDKIYP